MVFNNKKKVFVLFVMLFLIAGCMSPKNTRYYLYAGTPQNKSEVAIFVMQPDMLIHRIIDTSSGRELYEINTSPIGIIRIFDVMPGAYHLTIGYLDSGVSSWSAGDKVGIDVNVQAGHIYYFYHKELPEKKWRLIKEEFKDRDELLAYKHSAWDDFEDGKRIMERIDEHYRAKEAKSILN